MKSYTDLEQSKKLAEIMQVKSADMCFYNDGTAIKIDANPYTVRYSMWKDYVEVIPCWSLASLLSVIRKTIGYVLYGVNDVYISCELGDFRKIETKVYDNEVDACYELILKLHELNLL